MRDMDYDKNRSLSEESMEEISNKEMAQKMELEEKYCLKSDMSKFRSGLADKNQMASSSGLSSMSDQLKYFNRHQKDVAMDVSSENLQYPNRDSPLSADELIGIDEKTEKFDRNLEKFLKEREPLREVQLRKKTEISARQVKSDGEMAKIIEYYSNKLKLSSEVSNANRSSAPPTFNERCEPESIPGGKKISNESSQEKLILKGIAQKSDAFKKVPENSNKPSPSTSTALDRGMSRFSEFKVPISPNQKATPKNSPKMVQSDLKEEVSTPVQKRPTHFDLRPRKAFYTFSPGGTSEVLRQCQSLPNINRPQRKNEAQRRSINFGEHFRIVRSLFKDNPEPVTPASKVSTVRSSYKPVEVLETTENALEEEASKILQDKTSKISRKLVFGSSRELVEESQISETSSNANVPKAKSVRNASQEEEPNTLQNYRSKAIRKLEFGSFFKETADKSQNVALMEVCGTAEAAKLISPENGQQLEKPIEMQSRSSNICKNSDFCSSSQETADNQQVEVSKSPSESPSKRKSTSPIDTGYFISTKKVRTSSEGKFKESGNRVNEGETMFLGDAKCSISDENDITSSEAKKNESSQNIKLVDVGCSIPTKNARNSSGTETEGNCENIGKKEFPIDGECSTTAKKVKTTSEVKSKSGSG